MLVYLYIEPSIGLTSCEDALVAPQPERIDIWSAVRTHPLELPLFHIVGLIAFASCSIYRDFRRADDIPPPHPVHPTHQRENTTLVGLTTVRPENHMLHHARESTLNYSDPPIVDMIFGTFENPKVPLPIWLWDGASTALSITRAGSPVSQNRQWQVEEFMSTYYGTEPMLWYTGLLPPRFDVRTDLG